MDRCIASLNDKLKQSNKSREASDQSVRELNKTLEEENHKYFSTINQLEIGIMEYIREKSKPFGQFVNISAQHNRPAPCTIRKRPNASRLRASVESMRSAKTFFNAR
jgi:hypothetical protein